MKETKRTPRHVPVLLGEVLESLAVRPGMTVIDGTFGGGSHAEALWRDTQPGGMLIGLDRDPSALARFREGADGEMREALEKGTLVLTHANYSDLKEALQQAGKEKADAILADLGFSSLQIEDPKRGLSFQEDGPLDMRLDQSQGEPVSVLVNTMTEEALAKIFWEYGEEPEAKRIARAIIEARKQEPILSTARLRDVVLEAYPKGKARGLKIHPATRVFQGLRIAVNQEFEHLEQFLREFPEVLSEGGRIAVITFHSGEDRRVKQAFQKLAQGCICPKGFPICQCGQIPQVKIITKKPVLPSEAETKENPRARSAKLRVAEKC
ncbi:MAG: 16S rRNA (cytosine(1402)-N(4))-methyltransferase [Candidatus Moranbacteria bacterium RIFCSPHIGHO2_01_FULL_55_24]|nr:MAG: 16S rRNA (cytosine(1402)-N(4))-methyltransferase [Candidatus Moranbacteria bacterium RIFCSPHIGHO2_01_FULL_55_24]